MWTLYCECFYYPIFLSPHAVPEWLHPFSTQNAKDHHERVEEISEIPPEIREKINTGIQVKKTHGKI